MTIAKQSQEQARRARLLPGGVPKYIRCYDNGGVAAGGSIDRYTVVYTGNYRRDHDDYAYVAMNDRPFHPQGFGQHGGSRDPIDRPKYAHLGKRIAFQDLPEDCQTLVRQDYESIWFPKVVT